MRSRLLATVALAIGLASSSLFAQSDADKATARALAQEGETALHKKDFKTAADRFARAEQLFHAPTLVLGLARSNAGLGKLVEAQEEYNRVIHDSAGGNPSFVRAQADATKELKALEGRIPWVVLTLDGPGAGSAKATIDDVEFPSAAMGVKRAIDPGEHVAKASAQGGPVAEKTFKVDEGATAPVQLTVEAGGSVTPPVVVPPPSSSSAEPVATAAPSSSSGPGPAPQRSGGSALKPIGFVLLGVGALGLIAGGVGGGVALAKRGGLVDACDANAYCPRTVTDDVSQYKTFGTISTIGFIAGGVGVAGGALLLILAPKSKPDETKKAGVTPMIGVGSIGAAGRF